MRLAIPSSLKLILITLFATYFQVLEATDQHLKEFQYYSGEAEGWVSLKTHDLNESVELSDFGGDLTLHYSDRNFDTFINPHAAKEIRPILYEIYEKLQVTSKSFQLDEESSSDIYQFISITEEESTSRKCPKCGKSFTQSAYSSFHLIREHLLPKLLSQQPPDDLFILLDKTCSFFDCSRDKTLSALQTDEIKVRRRTQCMYFMAQNMQDQLKESESELDIVWNAEKYMKLCNQITGDEETQLIIQQESKFVRFLWNVLFFLFVLISSSYYGILCLTNEGRRAWLTPLK